MLSYQKVIFYIDERKKYGNYNEIIIHRFTFDTPFCKIELGI